MALLWAPVAVLLISISISATAFDLLDGGVVPIGSIDGQAKTFIIRVRNDMKPSAFASVEQWYASTVRTVNRNLDDSGEVENENTNNQFLHVYKTVFHGFATRLTPQQAEELKSLPGIIGVIPDRVLQLQTTRSPQFLGLTPSNPSGLLTESDSGENVIIGVLDTGIAPERRSFNDKGLGPIPTRWKGECVEGEKFSKSLCNRKLIGARYFTAGYGASMGSNKTEDIQSARDSQGHGTHTASTAAGRMVRNASFSGFAAGHAVGVAPKARIAVYKVCWSQGCLSSDILAGFDAAVQDGVDVISLSVGGRSMPYHMDPIALGSFGAMERGVLVSASAGNEGPKEMTLSNVAPWITTVGASTIDRDFPADLVLEDGRVITGASIYVGIPLPNNTYFPLFYAGGNNASALNAVGNPGGIGFNRATCQADSLEPALVRGKIVICDRGGVARVAKGKTVQEAGGVGVVVANVAPLGEGVVADPHVIPGLDITESAAYTVKGYIASKQNPRATIVFRGTQVDAKPAPVLASFSSRGPNSQSLYVLKPDVIAPGVNILAAWPDGIAPVEIPGDTRTTEFNIISGTSMSCPHVSGIAALLKGAHPNWSPAIIRSALMTTAYSRDRRHKPLLDQKALHAATVWDIGAGHVDPQRAVDPGLVYDLKVADYLKFLCNSNYSPENLRVIARREVMCPSKPGKQSDLNYPAISVVINASEKSKFQGTTVRTVKHVSDGAANYTVLISNPRDATVTVRPGSLGFTRKGEKQIYVVKVRARRLVRQPGSLLTQSGSLTWSDGKHFVTSPLLVVWHAHPKIIH